MNERKTTFLPGKWIHLRTLRNRAILFTGERHNNHFEIYIFGRSALLTLAMLRTMIDLVIARSATETGFLPQSPVAIRRLRRTIDQAVKPGTGKSLIETGSGEEYRITIARENIAGEVMFAPGFFELEKLKVISTQQAAELRRLEIGKKSRRNREEIDTKVTFVYVGFFPSWKKRTKEV